METTTQITATATTAEPARHPFDRAGLGKPPYKFLGMISKSYQACPGAPVQPGGSCDYCGQGIFDQYHVQSADGRRFKVGCDCIAKASKTASLFPSQRALDKAVRDAKTAKRHAREQARIVEGFAWIDSPEIAAKLAALPHPYKWQADKGLTFADFVGGMRDHAGNQGRLEVIAAARKALETR